MEVGLELSSGRIDLVFMATNKLGRYLKLELKNVDFDAWAWIPDAKWEGFLRSAAQQARRFATEDAGHKYLLRNIPKTPEGKQRLLLYIQRLTAEGVDEFAVGFDRIRTLLQRELT